MNKRLWALSLMLLSLTACSSSEGGMFDEISRRAATGSGAAGAGAASRLPAQQAPSGYNGQPLAPGASTMMQDPEAREESDSQYVWADDDTQAAQMCQRLADTYGGRMDRVTTATVKDLRNNWGKRKYICYFTRFVGGH